MSCFHSEPMCPTIYYNVAFVLIDHTIWEHILLNTQFPNMLLSSDQEIRFANHTNQSEILKSSNVNSYLICKKQWARFTFPREKVFFFWIVLRSWLCLSVRLSLVLSSFDTKSRIFLELGMIILKTSSINSLSSVIPSWRLCEPTMWEQRY